MTGASITGPDRCATCQSEMAADGTICRNCKPSLFQKLIAFNDKLTDFKKRTTALVAVLSAICGVVTIWLYRDSYTHFLFAGEDENHVVFSVINTGNHPSTLLHYRLIFDDLPGKELTLGLSQNMRKTASSVIQPRAPATISLTTLLPDEVPPSLRAKQYTDDDIAALFARKPLSQVNVSFEIDVRESDDPGGTLWLFAVLQPIDPGGRLYDFAPRQFHVRREHSSADRISRFINGSVR